MKKLILMILMLLVFVAGEVWAEHPMATSCSQFSLQYTTLIAVCPKDNGIPNTNHISLDSLLGNNNGKLQWGLTEFSKTCRNISLEWTRLKAECRDWYMNYHHTEFDLNEKLVNDDGILRKKIPPMKIL